MTIELLQPSGRGNAELGRGTPVPPLPKMPSEPSMPRSLKSLHRRSYCFDAHAGSFALRS